MGPDRVGHPGDPLDVASPTSSGATASRTACCRSSSTPRRPRAPVRRSLADDPGRRADGRPRRAGRPAPGRLDDRLRHRPVRQADAPGRHRRARLPALEGGRDRGLGGAPPGPGRHAGRGRPDVPSRPLDRSEPRRSRRHRRWSILAGLLGFRSGALPQIGGLIGAITGGVLAVLALPLVREGPSRRRPDAPAAARPGRAPARRRPRRDRRVRASGGAWRGRSGPASSARRTGSAARSSGWPRRSS